GCVSGSRVAWDRGRTRGPPRRGREASTQVGTAPRGGRRDPCSINGAALPRLATANVKSATAAVHTHEPVDVPVQYFQSVIAIELAVAGALLWQMGLFEAQ